MNKVIDFDNSATTKCDEKILEKMLPFLKEEYANPNSIYTAGREVREKIEEARRNVAKLLNADESEIVFTSSASESNTTAIMSTVRNNPNKKHIITTKVEHASIIEAMKYLETNGYKITYLSVDEKGRIDFTELENAITDDTCLISIMMANNELGNIYPVKEISKIAKKHKIIFHCDAVQAVGKMKIDVKEMDMDTLALSGHKIYAPKGIGVLYIKTGTPYIPLIFGHQEKNRRGGTENSPYIIGIGEAAKAILEDNYKELERLKKLRDKIEKELKENLEDVMIYGDEENRLPNILNIAFKGIKGEELLLLLESFNIYVSTGSACNSTIAEPSHVLTACRADLEKYSPIRISLGKYNTEEEADIFVKQLISIVNEKK